MLSHDLDHNGKVQEKMVTKEENSLLFLPLGDL